MSQDRDIARRSVASVAWNVIVSVVQVAVGLVRTTLLARLLLIDSFGIYRYMGSIVTVSAVFADFGMSGAFLHRAPETEDEGQAAAVYFTLLMMFGSVWALLMAAGAFIFFDGAHRMTLLLLTLTRFGAFFSHVPRAILVRRIVHRRLALTQLINVLLSAVGAVYLAWRGAELWALLFTDITTLVVNVVLLYLWRPVWRPRLTWQPEAMRYFLRFGSQNLSSGLLMRALDRVDDMWSGAYLGDTATGLYSRAYAFATYPRTFLSEAVNKVAGGTYAELKGNRKRLSQAFFRTNAFLVRTGFFLAGLLSLVAPEFILILLEKRWLPMMSAFRLMLIYTLLDPIKITVGNLFIAVGEPRRVVVARLIQLAVLVGGLFLLGPTWGIAGVAIAVDLMLAVGMAILLWQARNFVDFSLWRLFSVPTIGLISGLALTYGALSLPGVAGSVWRTGPVKVIIFSIAYSVTFLALEQKYLRELFTTFVRPTFRPIERTILKMRKRV